MNKERIIRTITPECRIIDAGQGIVDYVASDQTLDHYQEVLLAKGWRFDLFRKNAPFVDSHDYGCIDRLVGRVTDFKVSGSQLVERVKWAIDVPSCTLARLGFDLTEKGYLKAVSVGFIPEEWASRGGEPKRWADAVKEAGLTVEDAANCYRIFMQHQQIELSACIIGANPNALAKAFDDGVLREEQMAQLGLADDAALDFLRKAAAAWEKPACDELTRSMIGLELRRCYEFAKNKTHTESTASERDDAADSRHRAREKFLAELTRFTN